MIPAWSCLALSLAAAAPRAHASCAPSSAAVATPAVLADTAGVVAAQRAWWLAFARADTASLRVATAPAFSLTLSGGDTYDRPAMLAKALTNTRGASLAFAWASETVHAVAPRVAIVTSHVTETEGPAVTTYRFITVLRRDGARWYVAAAQSTREAAPTPRVPAGVVGPLADYAGDYRTPRGLVLRVVARDSALVLREPSGAESPLQPVGPALFELADLSPANGAVRFAFMRDATGRVAALVRMLPGAVVSFPRLP